MQFSLMDSTRVTMRGGYLSEENRRDLIELACDRTIEHRLARRANALVLLDPLVCGGVETDRRKLTACGPDRTSRVAKPHFRGNLERRRGPDPRIAEALSRFGLCRRQTRGPGGEPSEATDDMNPVVPATAVLSLPAIVTAAGEQAQIWIQGHVIRAHRTRRRARAVMTPP